jgi:hypothetical protein
MGVIDLIKGMFGANGEKAPPVEEPQAFPSKEDAVNFVKREFDRRQKERKPVELQWVLNMNYLNGNQNCDINATAMTITQTMAMYDWQEMRVYNKIAPIFETRLAKFKRVRPSPSVRPASRSSRDVSTAKTSRAILKGLDSDQEMQTKRNLATAWAEICGCAFYKHNWDVKSGRMIGMDETGEVYEGDISKYVISAFEIYPDSNFRDGMEGCKSIIHARAMHVDDIFENWGLEIKGRKLDIFTLNQTNGVSGLGSTSATYKFESTTVDKHEIVMEYMHLPCRQYPKGLIMVVIGNELPYYGDFVYRVGLNMKPGFNISMQMCIENPGYFWPTAIIERLIPIQQDYNAVKNKKREMLNRKAIGILDVEDDGNNDTEDLEEEGLYPGKILTHPRGGKPASFLVSKDSTQDFENEERRLEEEFVSISGVSLFASESSIAAGSSGELAERIKEADDSRLTLTADNINAAAVKGYKIDLRLYKQFATGPRVSKYIDENDEVDVAEWMASDLTSDDVFIDKEDEISNTPSARKQKVIELLQYKLFSNDVDPKTRSKVINLMQLGDWENANDIEERHISKAKRENKLIFEGIPPNFKPYDNHVIHKDEHDKQRLDVEYEQFEQANPQMAMLFDLHVQEHEAAIQVAMQQALMAQMATQPQPAK